MHSILFLPEHYLHKSCAIFHINHNILHNLTVVVPYSTNKHNYVKRAADFQNKPFACVDRGMKHLCSYRDKRMLTTV
jgi:hypothetical protein